MPISKKNKGSRKQARRDRSAKKPMDRGLDKSTNQTEGSRVNNLASKLPDIDFAELAKRIRIDLSGSSRKPYGPFYKVQELLSRFEYIVEAIRIEEEEGIDSEAWKKHTQGGADVEVEKIWLLDVLEELQRRRETEVQSEDSSQQIDVDD